MRSIIILFVVISVTSLGQTTGLDYYLPEDYTYNKDIPTPESIIGHPVGKWHVTHDKLVQYMTALAAASDRITIDHRGKTYEDRPLILLTITSPENHANLEEIRTNHLKLSTEEGRNIDTETMHGVIYTGFSIHGNEPSGSNAALIGAYYLASAEGDEIDELLNNNVILLDPAFNPDGLQRFAQWVNIHKSENLNPDGNDREYDEVWPGGRTNHYWFDMNRDWLPVQLPESRARIETFHNWLPNVLTDHHEMGTNSTFFFQPGVPARTHPLTPSENQQLTEKLGNYHASALDKIGSLYYSKEDYDDFYYGKGSTFPDVNGGIGILFEQASSRGHLQESDNGILTFPFTIRNQFTAFLSTLQGSKELRTDLLDYQREFYINARSQASKRGSKGYIFGSEADAVRSLHLAEILFNHKIKIHKLKNDVTTGGKSYKKDYSYIVPFEQDKYLLIKAMFEKRTSFTDSIFYDVSAWTYPLSFNLNYSEIGTLKDAGKELRKIEFPEGKVSEESSYAYLFEWHEYYTPKALYQVLKKGVRAKVGKTPFNLAGKSYDYGTIMIPVQNQDLEAGELYEFLVDVAQSSHIEIKAVSTGLTTGIDLGSGDFETLKLPEVAVLVGDGVRAYDAGEIWHLFDQRYDIPITKLDVTSFRKADISRYTAIIAPGSSSGIFGNSEREKLKNWVKAGGTLIGYRNATGWLKSYEFINFSTRNADVETGDISFEEKGRQSGAQKTGGAIFNTTIDRSHPVNFGYKKKDLPLFRNTNIFIEPDKNSYNNPIQYTNSPLLGGYISEENLEQLKNSVPFKVQNQGSGKVIIFTDNTNFRAFWYGTNKLLMNAIFFSKLM